MDILIITHFASTFSETDNDRFLYLAKSLAKDNDIEILTSSFCHEKKTSRNHPEYNWPFKITFLNEFGYKKNICLKRFFSHFFWGLQVKNYLNHRKIPDVIYCAVPSLTGPYFAAKFCKKKNIRFVIDIQDLWPEAFQMVFNVPLLSSLVFLPFRLLSNRIYKNANDIVAVSDTYLKRASKMNKKKPKTISVFLGTDLMAFDKYSKEPFGINKDNSEIWVGYCGTLGNSYDLSNVIKAISKIEDLNIRLVVMGDGPLANRFQTEAESFGIKSTFVGRVPYNKMVSLLCGCDIAINPISHGAAQSIINKHADYVASGLPIVSTQESLEFRSLIENYEMGINCGNDNIQEIANAIEKLSKDSLFRKKLGENARKCAEERFDRKRTYQQIVKLLIGN